MHSGKLEIAYQNIFHWLPFLTLRSFFHHGMKLWKNKHYIYIENISCFN